eukprot:COSAG02_NODE_3775_length_6252_cov_3.764505_8_plen_65_part_00
MPPAAWTLICSVFTLGSTCGGCVVSIGNKLPVEVRAKERSLRSRRNGFPPQGRCRGAGDTASER